MDRPNQADSTATGIAFGALGVLTVRFLVESLPWAVLMTNLALVLVLPILVTAAIAGRAPAVSASLVAAVNLAFEHDGPGGSWNPAGLDQILPALLLVAIGVIAGQVRSESERAPSR